MVELMRKRGKVGFCKVDAYDNSRLWREDHMDSDAVNTTVTLRAAAKIANAVEWPGQPPKIAPFPWGICTSCNKWFLLPTQVLV